MKMKALFESLKKNICGKYLSQIGDWRENLGKLKKLVVYVHSPKNVVS